MPSATPSRWCAPTAAAFTSFSTRTVDAEPIGEARPEVEALEPEVHGVRDAPGAAVDGAGDADADRRERRGVDPGELGHALARVRRAVATTSSAPKPVGMRTWSLSSPSAPIATAAVLVPPMSMPSLTARPP